MSRRRKIPGITVDRRGKTWAYRIERERHPLTGERQREYQGGFPTEDEAWRAALEAKARLEAGRAMHAKKIRVAAYLSEWLNAIEDDVKATTAQNYRDNVEFYIAPLLGKRWLGDLTVPTINAFYKHLRERGRRKSDGNWRMYRYWLEHQAKHNGEEPRAASIARSCGTTQNAAREAIRRYRRGRVPTEYTAGLSVKSVQNVHVVLRRALRDATLWGYLHTNPAEHAIVPRQRRRGTRDRREQVWTADQLGRWLRVALQDRYGGLWLLATSTGMRRSELAGLGRDMLDLTDGWLIVEDTRVVVGGHAVDSDGKSEAGRREISLDTFTVKHLRTYVATLDEERKAFGEEYPDHGLLMVGPDGTPLHPDTITARFNRLVDRAGVPRIRLHDVRHTYATLALDAGANVKTVSERIGHADTTVTLKIYTHRSRGQDREMAQQLGSLIEEAVEPKTGPVGTDRGTNDALTASNESDTNDVGARPEDEIEGRKSA